MDQEDSGLELQYLNLHHHPFLHLTAREAEREGEPLLVQILKLSHNVLNCLSLAFPPHR